MATEVTSSSADSLTGPMGIVPNGPVGLHGTNAPYFSSPDTDENMASAEAGAMGSIGPDVPDTGPVHWPNAATAGPGAPGVPTNGSTPSNARQ